MTLIISADEIKKQLPNYSPAQAEVFHRESGCWFKLDPRKVYFSQREGTERLRMCQDIKSGEKIMVFFAGIGAFPIIIAKKIKNTKVTGIEINPAAIRYFKENAKLNKVDIDIVKGDVKNVVYSKNYKGTFDRVRMPLPENAIDFINEAIYCLKKGGICNLYCFSTEAELNDIILKIKNLVEKNNRMFELIGTQKVLPWGPGIFKTRIDFMVI